MKKNILYILLLSLGLTLFLACSKPDRQKLTIMVKDSEPKKELAGFTKISNPTNTGSVPKAETGTTGGQFLNFGITPWATEKKLKEYFQPLMTYLSEKLAIRVNFYVALDYDQLKINLRDGKVDIASFSPGSFVDAIEEMPHIIKYLCTMVKKNSRGKIKSYYEGYIFAKSASNIRTLQDMKGKTIGFTNKTSSSGYRFPMAMLLKNNINPKTYFKSIHFLGNHDKVMSAVGEGIVDIGATWDSTFHDRKNDYGGAKTFNIIMKTPPIPLDTIAVRKQLDPALASKIKKLLLDLNMDSKTKDGTAIFKKSEGFPYAGFEKKNLAFYNIIKETNRILKKQ